MKLRQRPKLWDDLGIDGCFSWEKEAEFLADTLNIVKPKNILETGFFAGASAFMWLYLSDAKLTSVDPMKNLYEANTPHTGKKENIQKLKDAFPNRFTFLEKDSRLIRDDIKNEHFDLMFIDGDHWESGIINDFSIAIEKKIEWVLVDDFVTSVEKVYFEKFRDYFLAPIRIYPRKDLFQGNPIPIVLLKLKDEVLENKVFE
jgi:hypothetical protein